jgi:uncharacterized protein (TIGR00730 family)
VRSAVCVFCGSSPGGDPAFAAAARSLGQALAQGGRTLVFGGAQVGLMGAVADAALAAGGRVIGVVPRALVEREVAHAGLSELRVVGSMHERKAVMADLSDAFIALPGGLGTLEELLEIWTWAQLGLHAKPLGLLNTAGFYSPFLQFLDSLVGQRFLRPEHRQMVAVSEDAADLLTRLDRHESVILPKWIDRQTR